jgi:hypothetical protein
MASEIGRLFPRCPAGRAEAIARHTSLRGSGRVGRSAAGRSLDEEAITLAVVASVRHEDTEYDSLLMSGVSRQDARDRIRSAVDRILAAWAQPASAQTHDRLIVRHVRAFHPASIQFDQGKANH